jgi:hypothetical protein
MPKRPKQHEIDEIARPVFKASLPASWSVSPLFPDHAKDFLVEVVQVAEIPGRVFLARGDSGASAVAAEAFVPPA